jgi:hypothetical protein
MRFLAAILALLPIVATAQSVASAQTQTYQITSGSYVMQNPLGAVGGFAGNGFAATFLNGGGPEIFSTYYDGYIYAGEANGALNFCFGCNLPGTDDGVAELSVPKLNDPAVAGLVQSFGSEGYVESGGLTLSQTIDVTGPGIYKSAFTISADIGYGPSEDAPPTKYVDFVGHGTVTVDVGPEQCVTPPNIGCSPYQIKSVAYTFAAPELDPTSLGSALTLFAGGLLVIRSQRSRGS